MRGTLFKLFEGVAAPSYFILLVTGFLFATAIGLVAAIPAVIAYNKFSNDLNRYNDRLENFASEFSAILDRHLAKGGK